MRFADGHEPAADLVAEKADLPEVDSSDFGGENTSHRRKFSRADAGICLAYLAFALFVFSGQWLNLGHGFLYFSGQDQNMWEWFFSVTAKNILHGDNPL